MYKSNIFFICLVVILTIIHTQSYSQLKKMGDLKPIDIVYTSPVVAGNILEIKTVYQNTGVIPISAGWTGGIYLVKTKDSRSVSVRLSDFTESNIISPRSNHARTLRVVIPPNIVPGKYMLAVVLDVTRIIPESNESNNYLAKEIVINYERPDTLKPDLIPVSIESPPLNYSGKSYIITSTIKNQGNKLFSRELNIRIYLTSGNPNLSDNLVPDYFVENPVILIGDSTHLCFIPPGNEYTSNMEVNLPFNYNPLIIPDPFGSQKPLEGYWYTKIVVDPQNKVAESNETNNVLFSSNTNYITQPPDIYPADLESSDSAEVGSQITFTLTVCNSGGYLPNWQGYEIEILLENATNTVFVEQFRELTPCDPAYCNQIVHTVSLPSDIPAGIYHWKAVVDKQNSIEELNRFNTAESNNELNGNIIELKPVVDLVPTDLNVPDNIIQGSTLSINWSIANQGTGVDMNSSLAKIVISPDNDINSADYSILDKIIPPVFSGSPYESTDTVIFNVNPGSYFLGIIADATNTVIERNETNNTLIRAVPIVITFQPDLSAISISGPNVSKPGRNVTLGIVIKNQGEGNAPDSWERKLYLSTDNIVKEDDILIGSFFDNSEIASNNTASYQDNVTIPDQVPLGQYYLGIIISTNFPESNKSNNSMISTGTIRIH